MEWVSIVHSFFLEWNIDLGSYSHLWNLTAFIKAICFSTILVLLIRSYASIVKERYETKEKELDDNNKSKISNDVNDDESNKLLQSSKYPIPSCPVCQLPLYQENGLEYTKNSIIQLNCQHLLHYVCYINTNAYTQLLSNLDSSSSPFPVCPICFLSQRNLQRDETHHMWQTIPYWIWHINQALEQHGPSNFLSWATIRLRAKELANLSIDVLREGDLAVYGNENCRDEEDLIGPGAFPLRHAMLDAGRIHYEWNGQRYHTVGLWITHKSSEGTEREIWKISWGSPSWALCDECGINIPLCTQIFCDRCYQINPDIKYWCSAKCKEEGFEKHSIQCQKICQVWEEYQDDLQKKKEKYNEILHQKYSKT